MLYILFGNQPSMIKNRLTRLIKEQLGEPDAFNFVRFDSREVTVQAIADEAMYVPLGVEKKAIVIDYAYYLAKTPTKEKIESDQNYDVLFKYVEQMNPEVDLFFLVYSGTLDKKSLIVKAAENHGKIFELTDIKPEEWPEYIRRYFSKLEAIIDNDAVTELQSRIGSDAQKFVTEANKLATYTKHITKETIELMVARPFEESSFALTNALVKNDKEKALRIYRDLMTLNQEPIMFIAMVANQFRLYSEVFILAEKGNNLAEISKILGVHEYRCRLALQVRNVYSLDQVLQVLDQLYLLDFQIKSGQVDRYYGFELFLINYGK